MAKPIQITPVLKGKDAITFFNKLEENKNRPVEKAYLSEIRNNARQLQSILKVK